jgi:hypothetical protein
VAVEDAWHAFRWIWSVILLAYLAVQIVAAWRLDSGGKKRARNILIAVLVLMTAQNFVRDVFENRVASRVGSLIVAGGALVGTAVLLRMLRTQWLRGATGIDSGSDDPVQPLKLN